MKGVLLKFRNMINVYKFNPRPFESVHIQVNGFEVRIAGGENDGQIVVTTFDLFKENKIGDGDQVFKVTLNNSL